MTGKIDQRSDVVESQVAIDGKEDPGPNTTGLLERLYNACTLA